MEPGGALKVKTVIFEALADISRAIRGIAFVAELITLIMTKLVGALSVPPPLPLEVGHDYLLMMFCRLYFPVQVP